MAKVVLTATLRWHKDDDSIGNVCLHCEETIWLQGYAMHLSIGNGPFKRMSSDLYLCAACGSDERVEDCPS